MNCKMDKRLQERVLNELFESGKETLLFLRNGVQMRGVVEDYDDISLLIRTDGSKRLIYLSMLSTVDIPEALDV